MVSDLLSDANGRGQKWMDAWNEQDKGKKHAMIRDLLKGYQAVVDCPVSLMVEDFVEMYPDAKVSSLGVYRPRNMSEGST